MKKTIYLSSVLTVTMASLNCAAALDIHVLSATVKDQNIANADVILQKNGERSAANRTNAQGRTTVETQLADTADNLREVATTGVDYISMGVLTKDVKAIDLSMRFNG